MSPRLAVTLRAAGVRRGEKWVLRGITWQLRPGERWALLGENGAGKTQLLKLLAGDIWPTPTRASAEPRTYRAGRHAVDLREAKQQIAYLGGEGQDKYARYGWNLRVREVIASGLHRSDLLTSPVTRTEWRQVSAMLDTCGIRRLASRKFLTLSYGERRLALLARVLVQQPDWLLLDEPYNGLDGEYRRRVDAVLAAVRAKGQSWVATAHRAMDIPPGSRLLIELSAGRIRRRKRASGADFAQLRARAGEAGMQALRRRPEQSKPETADAPLLLRLTNADLHVGCRAVLRAVNWQLRQGEHWSVVGANGAGKSSFLKLLYGDLAPALGGKIERAGHPRGAPIFEWKRRVGFVSAELQGLFATSIDVLELVASGRHSSIGLAAPMTAAERSSARTWLAFFKLRSLAGRPACELSYGQLRRALIARAMAAQPQLLLLDEPLTGLDPKQRSAMKHLLERLMRRQVTVVAAVHHAEDLPRGMTHQLHLHKRHARVADSHFAT